MTASVRPKKIANSEEIDQTLPPLNLDFTSSCYCFDHEKRLCLASFHSHRDPEDEHGEEGLVDPLGDPLINSEDEDVDLTVIRTVQSLSMTLIPVIPLRSRSLWNISLSLDQTGRDDIRRS